MPGRKSGGKRIKQLNIIDLLMSDQPRSIRNNSQYIDSPQYIEISALRYLSFGGVLYQAF
jgi:hypothetical protein